MSRLFFAVDVHCRYVRGLLFAIAVLATPSLSSAYKPEDPEVRGMVDRAIKYLEGQDEKTITQTPYEGNDAQPILVAYAHFKAEHNHDSPVVKMGLKYAMQYVSEVSKNGGRIKAELKSIYEIPVVILFLAELDAAQYASELKMLGNALLNLQKSTGGFGYPDWKTGDISQVQYVALAAWTLDRSGIDISLDRVASMLAWLMRVQDVSGAWPYQGEDPGVGRGLIPQPKEEMSVTMCLAGGSASLIASDVFRIWDNTTLGNKIAGLPKALKPVDKSELVAQRRKRSPVKPDEVFRALRSMESYRGRNPYHREKSGDWYYYMLYTLERYESFFEMASGKPSNPSWYDEQVTNLMALQDASGAWGVKDSSKNNGPVSTAFAVLFLIRSSQKAISNVSKGTMRGGYGIPANTAEIQVQGAQIVSKPVADSVENLLGMLEEDGANNIDGKSIPEDLQLENDPGKRAAQLDRLSRLLRGSKEWQARRVAARLLGKSDDLSIAPTLIFALSDGDKTVRAYALDGLNFISRKFTSNIDIREANVAEIRKIQQGWMQWYKTIDPAYIGTSDY